MMDAAAPDRVVIVRDFCAGLHLIFNPGQNLLWRIPLYP
jgi:hypothetical protein